MKVTLELLFSFNCPNCDRYWTQPDIPPVIGQTITCLYCASDYAIEEIDYETPTDDLGQLALIKHCAKQILNAAE